VVEEIDKNGTAVTTRPGQTTVIRHPDGKQEEVPPLSPAQQQAIINQLRCFQHVYDAIQQTDAATAGTPSPGAAPVQKAQENPIIINPYGYGSTMGGRMYGGPGDPGAGIPLEMPVKNPFDIPQKKTKEDPPTKKK